MMEMFYFMVMIVVTLLYMTYNRSNFTHKWVCYLKSFVKLKIEVNCFIKIVSDKFFYF